MKTFITEEVRKNEKEYGFYEGPKINALSWENAKKETQKQGVTLIGELAD